MSRWKPVTDLSASLQSFLDPNATPPSESETDEHYRGTLTLAAERQALLAQAMSGGRARPLSSRPHAITHQHYMSAASPAPSSLLDSLDLDAGAFRQAARATPSQASATPAISQTSSDKRALAASVRHYFDEQSGSPQPINSRYSSTPSAISETESERYYQHCMQYGDDALSAEEFAAFEADMRQRRAQRQPEDRITPAADDEFDEGGDAFGEFVPPPRQGRADRYEADIDDQRSILSYEPNGGGSRPSVSVRATPAALSSFTPSERDYDDMPNPVRQFSQQAVRRGGASGVRAADHDFAAAEAAAAAYYYHLQQQQARYGRGKAARALPPPYFPPMYPDPRFPYPFPAGAQPLPGYYGQWAPHHRPDDVDAEEDEQDLGASVSSFTSAKTDKQYLSKRLLADLHKQHQESEKVSSPAKAPTSPARGLSSPKSNRTAVASPVSTKPVAIGSASVKPTSLLDDGPGADDDQVLFDDAADEVEVSPIRKVTSPAHSKPAPQSASKPVSASALSPKSAPMSPQRRQQLLKAAAALAQVDDDRKPLTPALQPSALSAIDQDDERAIDAVLASKFFDQGDLDFFRNSLAQGSKPRAAVQVDPIVPRTNPVASPPQSLAPQSQPVVSPPKVIPSIRPSPLSATLSAAIHRNAPPLLLPAVPLVAPAPLTSVRTGGFAKPVMPLAVALNNMSDESSNAASSSRLKAPTQFVTQSMIASVETVKAASNICPVPHCGRVVQALGFCAMHFPLDDSEHARLDALVKQEQLKKDAARLATTGIVDESDCKIKSTTTTSAAASTVKNAVAKPAAAAAQPPAKAAVRAQSAKIPRVATLGSRPTPAAQTLAVAAATAKQVVAAPKPRTMSARAAPAAQPSSYSQLRQKSGYASAASTPMPTESARVAKDETAAKDAASFNPPSMSATSVPAPPPLFVAPESPKPVRLVSAIKTTSPQFKKSKQVLGVPSRNLAALSLDVEENKLRASLARLEARLGGMQTNAPTNQMMTQPQYPPNWAQGMVQVPAAVQSPQPMRVHWAPSPPTLPQQQPMSQPAQQPGLFVNHPAYMPPQSHGQYPMAYGHYPAYPSNYTGFVPPAGQQFAPPAGPHYYPPPYPYNPQFAQGPPSSFVPPNQHAPAAAPKPYPSAQARPQATLPLRTRK